VPDVYYASLCVVLCALRALSLPLCSTLCPTCTMPPSVPYSLSSAPPSSSSCHSVSCRPQCMPQPRNRTTVPIQRPLMIGTCSYFLADTKKIRFSPPPSLSSAPHSSSDDMPFRLLQPPVAAPKKIGRPFLYKGHS
jgi:hypothetical protein